MANKITQLVNESGDNLYPLAGGMAADSINTQMLKDASVTSDKIDYATIKYNTDDTITIGDSVDKVSHRFVAGGLITASATQISFNIPLPKSAVGTNPTFTSGILAIRHVGGGYVFPDTDITTFATELYPLNNNSLGVQLKKSDGTAFSGVTNNTPLAIAGYFTIKF